MALYWTRNTNCDAHLLKILIFSSETITSTSLNEVSSIGIISYFQRKVLSIQKYFLKKFSLETEKKNLNRSVSIRSYKS
ncbi:hypothetical protein NPIL_71431 [Nephila pilipes]|uniref:Uncharacterized protein n=1 Tax=Nephila pilipes TaxID=299642 RepID=A0A8X6PFW4_NEPPI|nr:hypothetical protein NPIL_71431 [Nephila pilipes]